MAKSMKTKPDRTDVQIQKDRAAVSQLMLKQYTLEEISTKLGLTYTVAKNDANAVRKAWRNSSIANVDELRREQLDKIDVLEQTHWRAWDKLKDIRHLDGVMKCIVQRSRLAGLEKVELPPDLLVATKSRTTVTAGVGQELISQVDQETLVMIQQINDDHKAAGIGHYRDRPILDDEQLELQEAFG